MALLRQVTAGANLSLRRVTAGAISNVPEGLLTNSRARAVRKDITFSGSLVCASIIIKKRAEKMICHKNCKTLFFIRMDEDTFSVK